jgi:hypothetical protein
MRPKAAAARRLNQLAKRRFKMSLGWSHKASRPLGFSGLARGAGSKRFHQPIMQNDIGILKISRIAMAG